MTKAYICLGPLCWGKGKTPAEARKNAKANWPRNLMNPAKWRESMYEVNEDAYVDELGNICGKDLRNTVREVKAAA